MYNDQLVYKVVIWAFFGISLGTEKVALNRYTMSLGTISETVPPTPSYSLDEKAPQWALDMLGGIRGLSAEMRSFSTKIGDICKAMANVKQKADKAMELAGSLQTETEALNHKVQSQVSENLELNAKIKQAEGY